MIEIDGGEGGGQLLRSSLALAALTERGVRVTNIRGNRSEPGLKPQHLTAVETLADMCDAALEGATPGSETVTFEPGPVRGGQVEADIGTAGSLTLLFEAVLPLAAALEEPLSVTATGGTEVKWSPPLSTYRLVKLPLARRFGLHAALERHRTGFYPAGGGRATLHLAPSTPAAVSLTDRGSLVGGHVHSRESRDLAAKNVARRQAGTARSQLQEAEIELVEEVTATAATRSTGSALTVVLEYEKTRAGFDALGEPGTPAESVATGAVESALAFHGSGDTPDRNSEELGVVDRHTADQLLILLALAGGEVRIPAVTAHVASSLALLDTFGFDISLDESGAVPTVTAGRADTGDGLNGR